MNLKDIGNALKLPLGALGTVAGGVFTGISAYILFFGGDPPFWKDLEEGWWWWVLIIAAAVLIAGAYYLGDAIWRRRKFRELVYNNKRSEFLKNEREINRLLSGLPRKYKDTVAERKRELKIKE